MSGDLPEDDAPDVAAAELALGLLDGDERAHALRRVLAEPGFARQVERWRAQFAQLFDLWPTMPAPQGIWVRIERTLDAPAVAPSPAQRPSRFWPALATLSTIAAAVLLVLLLRPAPPAPGPTPKSTIATPGQLFAASIAPKAGVPVAAIYDPAFRQLRLASATLGKAGKSAELWVIGGDGVPHALGLLSTAGATALPVGFSNRTRLAAGATLAVSIEPLGGSPTGLPTGPVVATGVLSAV